MAERPYRRRRLYVHVLQRKYLVLSLVPLIISSFLIIFFLFVPLDILLFSGAPAAEKEAAVLQLRVLGIRVWPPIFLAMLLSAALSVLVTHRIAGPVYRFGQIAQRVAEGDLTVRVRLRQGDDLTDLEGGLNAALAALAARLRGAKEALAALRQEVERLAREPGQPANVTALRRQAEALDRLLAPVKTD